MARMAEQEGAVAVEHDQGIERKEEDIESFWSNTSYKVAAITIASSSPPKTDEKDMRDDV